ncbi:hypothetical protein BH23GEM9_BH23GEM9_13830 [soil metagenome]
MPRMQQCYYKDTPENFEMVKETAELLGLSRSAFIRLAVESAVKKVNYSGAMRQLHQRQQGHG